MLMFIHRVSHMKDVAFVNMDNMWGCIRIASELAEVSTHDISIRTWRIFRSVHGQISGKKSIACDLVILRAEMVVVCRVCEQYQH
jgi:hypothetical protein